MYSFVVNLPLVILNGFNAWKWWIRCPAATYMDTLQYLLNLVGWQESQVIEHAKALVGTVNTASLNLIAEEVGPILYF